MSVRARVGAPLLIAGLAGCQGACDFPDIRGGSERTRGNVEAALEHFFLGVPEDAVCVASVRVADVPGESAGRYNSATRAFWIEERVDLSEEDRDVLEWIATTHEACHASHYQLDIEIEAGPTWDFETDSYEDAEIPTEAFSFTCQFGAETLQLLGESCPDDTVGAEAFPFVLEHVYTRPFPGVVPLDDARWEPVASATLPGAEDIGFDMAGTVDDNLRIALRDGSSIRYVSVDTGEPGALSPQLTSGEAPTLLGRHEMLEVRGWASTGEAELLLVEAHAPNGGIARRLLHRDADGIGRLGCLRTRETVFAAEGRLWSAYAEGDDVTWGYWHTD